MLKWKGFTLVEILVVLSIIAILAAIVLSNYRAGEKQFALQRSANKLARDIRRAQEMAMSARDCNVCGGGVPAGYGVVLDANWDSKNYRLYADDQFDQSFTLGPPADTIVEPSLELEKGVIMQPIRVSINFRPPDPEIKIKDLETGSELPEAIISLSLEDEPTKTKTIRVNEAGLIYVD